MEIVSKEVYLERNQDVTKGCGLRPSADPQNEKEGVLSGPSDENTA